MKVCTEFIWFRTGIKESHALIFGQKTRTCLLYTETKDFFYIPTLTYSCIINSNVDTLSIIFSAPNKPLAAMKVIKAL
jgi:hypothetical protein